MLRPFAEDFRHACRSLRHAPGFALVAIAVLALGIGVNSTVFSILNGVLFRPLPLVPEPDRIAWISRVLSYDEFRRAEDARSPFDAFAGFTGISVNVSTGTHEGGVIRAQVVTAGFFDVFGVHPSTGRALVESDIASANPVAVISDRLWRRQFDPAQSPVGAEISLNGLPFTIIGVMPAGFIDEIGLPHDAWVPVTLQPQIAPGPEGDRSLIASHESRWLNVAGRLEHTATPQQAERALQGVLYPGLPPRFNGDREREVTLMPMKGGLDPRDRRDAGPLGAILMALVGLVLVIACANVANLLLARGSDRSRDLAIRRALGATRGRIVAHLLAESLVLALAGGASGLLLTLWVTDSLRTAAATSSFAMMWDIGPDVRVLVFTFAASVSSAVAAGLLPALDLSRPALTPALHQSIVAFARTFRRSRVRGFLIGSQVALSLLLLVGAALLVRTLQRATAMDPGFDPNGRALGTLDVAPYGETRGAAVLEGVLERLSDDPDIRGAALVQFPPLTQSGGGEWSVGVEGRPETDDSTGVNIVSRGYFETLAIPIVRGRAFTSGDRTNTEAVALVNETFARTYWGDANPLGRRIRLDGKWRTVVGVARDGKYRSLGEAPQSHAYLPLAQHYEPKMVVVTYAPAGVAKAIAAMRHTVRAIDATLPVIDVHGYPAAIEIAYLPARAGAAALGVFGLLALTLASAGVYGVMAYAVSGRRHEIGVRIALGGKPADVLRLVIKDGLRAAATGAFIGLIAAASLAPLARAAFYGLNPLDPAAFAAALLVLGSGALVAGYLPARRAVRIDPAVALREE